MTAAELGAHFPIVQCLRCGCHMTNSINDPTPPVCVGCDPKPLDFAPAPEAKPRA
jgi:hypothetical protein